MLTETDLEALDAWSELQECSPLATAILWHHESPARTSQRRPFLAFHELLLLFVLGGNRTGKSEGGGQLAVAMALGRSHPDVRAWLRNNQLPGGLIPDGPGLVWAVALTHKDSKEYVRAKIRRYAPAGTIYKGWDAEDQAEAILPNGSRIVCKCVRQGRAAFQGQAMRLVWFDEEPPRSRRGTGGHEGAHRLRR